MKYSKLTYVLVAGFILVLAACSQASPDWVATVDDQPISIADLQRAYWMQRVNTGEAEPALSKAEALRIKHRLVDQLIRHRLLLIQARALGMTIDTEALQAHLETLKSGYGEADFAAKLKKMNLSLAEWEEVQQEKFLIQDWIRNQVIPAVQVSINDAKKYYREHAKDFFQPAQVHALHIFVDSREKAEQLYKELEAGADFAELARQHSMSPEAAEGGDLGYFAKGEYPPVFVENCFALKKGRHSKVISSDYGYHLFKALDKRKQKRQNYQEAEAAIRELLTQQRAQALIEDKVRQLSDTIRVKVDESVLEKVVL